MEVIEDTSLITIQFEAKDNVLFRFNNIDMKIINTKSRTLYDMLIENNYLVSVKNIDVDVLQLFMCYLHNNIPIYLTQNNNIEYVSSIVVIYQILALCEIFDFELICHGQLYNVFMKHVSILIKNLIDSSIEQKEKIKSFLLEYLLNFKGKYFQKQLKYQIINS
jgi:hypothetical protein